MILTEVQVASVQQAENKVKIVPILSSLFALANREGDRVSGGGLPPDCFPLLK